MTGGRMAVHPEEGGSMDDKRLAQLMDQFAVDLMEEDLRHDSWVVLVWIAGNTSGRPPEAAHGPYGSAVEALTKAELLRQQMEGAEGRHTFMAGYTPTINVVPVYADEEETE